MMPALLLFVLAAAVALGAVALRLASAGLFTGRLGRLFSVFVADPFTATARLAYVDEAGNRLPGLPKTLDMELDDVVGNKVTFTDYDDENFFIVEPGPPGAYGMVFLDYQTFEDGADTRKVNLVLGRTETELGISHRVAIDTNVTPKERMQGLEELLLQVGTRFGFIQR